MLNLKRFCYSLGSILVKNLRNSWTKLLANLEKYHAERSGWRGRDPH